MRSANKDRFVLAFIFCGLSAFMHFGHLPPVPMYMFLKLGSLLVGFALLVWWVAGE